MTGARKRAIAGTYAFVAYAARRADRVLFEQSCAALDRVEPGYRPSGRTFVGVGTRILGFRRAHRLAAWLSALRERPWGRLVSPFSVSEQ